MGFKVTGDLEVTGAVKIGADTLTATGAELNFVDGVTSAIQTQIDGKAGLTNWGTPQGGYKFDGVDDYVSVADNANLKFGTGDFSLSWYGTIPNGSTAINTFISKAYASSPYTGFSLALWDGATSEQGKPVFVTNNNNKVRTVNTYNDGKKHFIVATRNSTTSKIYVDGILEATTTASPDDIDYVIALTLSQGGTYYHTGDTYLTRLYNRALTASEVTKLYNNGRPDLASLEYADLGASQTDALSGHNYDYDQAYWDKGDGIAITTGQTDPDAGTNAELITHAGTDKYSFVRVNNLLSVSKYYKYEVIAKAGTSDYISIALNYNGGQLVTFRFSTHTFSNISSLISSYSYTDLGSGWYKIIVTGIVLTSTNYIGFSVTNASGVEYGTDFGTLYVYSSNLYKIGCVAEYLPSNCGKIGWIETQNGLHGQTSGSPISLLAEQRPLIYRDVKLAIATGTPTLLTGLVPKGYAIKSIVAKGSASLTAIKIGTSSSGEQIVASSTATTTGTMQVLASTANAGYNITADTNVYVEHTTAGETMDVVFLLEKVQN